MACSSRADSLVPFGTISSAAESFPIIAAMSAIRMNRVLFIIELLHQQIAQEENEKAQESYWLISHEQDGYTYAHGSRPESLRAGRRRPQSAARERSRHSARRRIAGMA